MQVGVPDHYGRVYTEKVVETALLSLATRMLKEVVFGTAGTQEPPCAANASHILIRVALQDNGVVFGHIRVLDTPRGRILQKLLDEGQVEFRPRGYAKLAADGFVEYLELESVNAVPRRDSGYIQIG